MSEMAIKLLIGGSPCTHWSIAQKNNRETEPSGMGRYCLDKMGFTNVKYFAYEIDKYPMAIANDNYPDIIQCGDAFAVREDSWKPPKTRSEWLDELLEVSK
jgi:site-specific DNA-cytosine methylase